MQIEFYKIVSQIVPILFLGFTVQSTYLSRKEVYSMEQPGDKFRRNIHIGTIATFVITLFLGEFVALRSVYTNIVHPNDLFIVVLTMTFSVVYISLEFALAVLNKSKEIYLFGSILFGLVLEILVFFR